MKQNKGNVNRNKPKRQMDWINKSKQPVKTFYAIVKRGKSERVFTYKSYSRIKAKNHLDKVTKKHDYIITYFGVLGT
ncbi:hypothetical protein M3205_03625 [Cytobacillus firmus]|uniref:hypothetical protein n=1 Tax=Cytobacillus firmus TaxID=1399 RepID=UPI0020412700|nr:hypothetical protein [Cytobacillus firmus]MCM3704807.1 hypothetical protein [Cytobacillus firmus]